MAEERGISRNRRREGTDNGETEEVEQGKRRGQEKPHVVDSKRSHKEIQGDPKAIEAIHAEGQNLVKARTWDETTVIEKSDLIARARKDGKKIHLGGQLIICGIKHWEEPARHKHKGRVTFRGDSVKDELGSAAVFQELSASPTGIHTANARRGGGVWRNARSQNDTGRRRTSICTITFGIHA